MLSEESTVTPFPESEEEVPNCWVPLQLTTEEEVTNPVDVVHWELKVFPELSLTPVVTRIL